ncbi:MAG: putative toxin-antitoxin system toxin component, PIN family [Syntrophomonadaceae bacterium]|jgi:putative PIN family toxin of toxin-antitoxin system|nr:putative toxin-antitoxin system toxin component, PIN family [Syntrophomonadaceae bacterium]
MNVVLDTNILVSALWTEKGNPHKILDMIGRNEIKPCYDYRIITEYRDVLSRPKFSFSARDINSVLNGIKAKGFSTIAKQCAHNFTDETDRAFYEVAVTCNAYLITGNSKHFPNEPLVLSPAQFLVLLDFEKWPVENPNATGNE